EVHGVDRPETHSDWPVTCVGTVSALPSWLLVDQHILLPFPGLFVGAMNAARPTTWPLLAFENLFNGPIDALYAGLFLFCIFNASKKLITADWRQPFPQLQRPGAVAQGLGQVCWYLMHKTAGGRHGSSGAAIFLVRR